MMAATSMAEPPDAPLGRADAAPLVPKAADEAASATQAQQRVLYVCNDYAYFQAHRRWLAEAASAEGWNVHVACGGLDAYAPPADVIALEVDRHSFQPLRDFRLGLAVARLARDMRPDVVHLITIKPIVFGSLGLRLSGSRARLVVTFPGLGRVFDLSDGSRRGRFRRWLVTRALRAGLAPRHATAIFETARDRDVLVGRGVVEAARAHHIAGAGVDPSVYRPLPLPPGPLRILFAGRLLRSKGVELVAEAARLADRARTPVEFLVAGAAQPGDPDGLGEAEVRRLATASSSLRMLGFVPTSDMPALLGSVHVVVLPTRYQEGVPRILIEAASVGRPSIVSDNPGCLAFVEPDRTGLVLADCSAGTIAAAAGRLAGDRGLLERLAAGAARRFIAGGFSEKAVKDRTLRLYRP